MFASIHFVFIFKFDVRLQQISKSITNFFVCIVLKCSLIKNTEKVYHTKNMFLK